VKRCRTLLPPPGSGSIRYRHDMPLIVVDAVGLLCGGLTLAVALSLRGSLIRPATWNSRSTTSIPQRPQPHTQSSLA
jgi:hypothetical protein